MNVVVSAHPEYETFEDRIFRNMQQDDGVQNLVASGIQDELGVEEVGKAWMVYPQMPQWLQQLNVIDEP